MWDNSEEEDDDDDDDDDDGDVGHDGNTSRNHNRSTCNDRHCHSSHRMMKIITIAISSDFAWGNYEEDDDDDDDDDGNTSRLSEDGGGDGDSNDDGDCKAIVKFGESSRA